MTDPASLLVKKYIVGSDWNQSHFQHQPMIDCLTITHYMYLLTIIGQIVLFQEYV